MSQITVDFISPGILWDDLIRTFNNIGSADIYFDSTYISLYTNPEFKEIAEAFLFKSGKDIFFFPYIKKQIPDSGGLWDFETVYGYSGPLSTTQDISFLEDAWNHFFKIAKEIRLIAGFVRFNPLLNNERYCRTNQIIISPERKTVWLDCSRGIDDILSDYSRKHLKQIRSLESQGVYVQSSNSLKFINEFRKIYLNRMKTIGAQDIYHYDKDYFKKINSMSKENWLIHLAFTPAGEIMGGCLLLKWNETIHYHLSGSYSDFLKYKPNDILRHHVVKDSVEKGIKRVHFGGGRNNEPDDSLLKFKMKFSKQTFQFNVGHCIVDREKYSNLCKDWEIKFPEKEQYKNFFLKYRF